MLPKNLLQILTLGLLLVSLGYVWYQVPVPCSTPLAYSIGQFDPRFNISQDEFIKDLAQGEKPWEETLGKDIFQYDPNSAFKVNLIFDERQARTLEEQKLETSRQTLEQKQSSITMTQQKRLASFTTKKTEYDHALANFQSELQSYNAEAEYWNNHGGAPPEEYQKLQTDKKRLQKEQSDLEILRTAINTLASEINATSKQAVSTVDQYNSQVKDFLERHDSEPEDFDEGIYDGTEISIYQFDDEARLRAVIAHEFGHWLGLDHVANPASIMYHLMGSQDSVHLTLTSEDKAALQTVCSMSRFDIFKQKLGILENLLKNKFSPQGS